MKSLQVLVQEIKQLDKFWWIVTPINSSGALSFGVEADFFDRKGNKISGKIVDHNKIELGYSVVSADEITAKNSFLVDTYVPNVKHAVEKIKSRTPSVPPPRRSSNPPRR